MKIAAIAIAVLLMLCAALGYLLKASYKELGAAQLALDGANAVIKQKEEDHAFSREQVAKLAGQLEERSRIVQPIRERIIQMPASVACVGSPAIQSALGGMRNLVCSRPGNKDPGCNPADTVQKDPAASR